MRLKYYFTLLFATGALCVFGQDENGNSTIQTPQNQAVKGDVHDHPKPLFKERSVPKTPHRVEPGAPVVSPRHPMRRKQETTMEKKAVPENTQPKH